VLSRGVRCALALLGDGPVEPSRHLALLDELGVDLCGLVVAAPAIEGLVGRALTRPARLVASLHPDAGLLGALQSALLVGEGEGLLALDAGQPPPAVEVLRRLLVDPRRVSALVFRRSGELGPLPGRFCAGFLGPLSRALLEGERDFPEMLRRLRCSSL
jgi:hypothetical protein